jgi:hypothetical protein
MTMTDAKIAGQLPEEKKSYALMETFAFKAEIFGESASFNSSMAWLCSRNESLNLGKVSVGSRCSNRQRD